MITITQGWAAGLVRPLGANDASGQGDILVNLAELMIACSARNIIKYTFLEACNYFSDCPLNDLVNTTLSSHNT